ncbi:MAG: exodeoxyribonuclease VII large subunit [Prevotella sp.]|nr:exodeoxyribonuclease VII large subunit [Prevotella sp.]
MTTLSLFELNNLVAETLSLELSDEYWVEAELSEAREVRGHCYMELVQKEESSHTPIARASAKCWKNRWNVIGPYFERLTSQPLHAGMKVLLKVYANFHEAYGFSWIVTDINPEYTMGDMLKRRQAVIEQLRMAGIFDLQKELEMPLLPRRIAVISSASAAGYGDFCAQLAGNDYGFKFATRLFPAVMQGEQVEESIVSALNSINEEADNFDVVVIIRGGGATADLSGFDTLRLAENVAQFPLPIITGIGHERDESILDIVSHAKVKTPTAAAELIISRYTAVWHRIGDAEERMLGYIGRRMEYEHMRLSRVSEKIPVVFSLVKARQTAAIGQLQSRLHGALRHRLVDERHHIDIISGMLQPLADRGITKEKHRLQLLVQRVEAQDPERLLRRGYSITLHNGRALKGSSRLVAGDILVTRLAEGSVTSVVESKENGYE